MDGQDATPHPAGVAFLLAQLGAHAADRFAERLAQLGLTPPLAGVIRLVGREPALSQRELARRLGAAPSRVVALVDELEHTDLLTRTRSTSDRRVYQLELTAAGQRMLQQLSTVARAHEEELTAALDQTERRELRRLLTSLADANNLAPGIHPGYQKL